MIIKTKDFQDVAKKILLATSLDKNACNLELITKGSDLYLNVTNKEYFVAIKFALDTPEEFHATVDANLFLSLISALTTETFTLSIKKNSIDEANELLEKLFAVRICDASGQNPEIVDGFSMSSFEKVEEVKSVIIAKRLANRIDEDLKNFVENI